MLQKRPLCMLAVDFFHAGLILSSWLYRLVLPYQTLAYFPSAFGLRQTRLANSPGDFFLHVEAHSVPS